MFEKASEKDGKSVIHPTIKIMGILTCHLVINRSQTDNCSKEKMTELFHNFTLFKI